MASWASLKVVDLKAELRKRGLPQGGLKAELISRLDASDRESVAPKDQASQLDAGDESLSHKPRNGHTRDSEAESDNAENDNSLADAHETPTDQEEYRSQKGYEMHGALATAPSPSMHEAKAAHRSPIPSNFDQDTAMFDGGSDDLKRKRRSTSPTPKEFEFRRKRAPHLPDDAITDTARPYTTRSVEDALPDRMDPPSPAPGRQEQELDYPGEIEPSTHEKTRAIYINNLMRPIKEADLRHYLVDLERPQDSDRDERVLRTFYIDSIRTHAFAVFESTASASRVRRNLHGRVWPRESNRKALFVDFVPEDRVDEWIHSELSDNDSQNHGQRWEVVYRKMSDGSVDAVLQSTSVTGVSKPVPAQTAGKPPAASPPGIERAPTGPRAYQAQAAYASRPPPQNFGQPSSRNPEDVVERTKTEPWVSFRPVDAATVDRRLRDLRGYYCRDVYFDPGSDINRYTFQDGHVFVDRGREIFAGIRPPHRQQAVDRNRAWARARGGGGAPRGRGGFGYGRDRYTPV